MEKMFDEILNECIDRLIKGDSIQTCLEAYPEYRKELEPLLLTAITTLQAADIQPRPEFRQRAAWEYQKALLNLKQRRVAHNPLKLQLRWLIPVTVVFVILVAGTGTVFAASNSLPDQPLYGVKLFTENTRLALTRSAAGKAQLNAEFADIRVNEIVQMAEVGKVAEVEKATERLNNNLAAIVKLTSPDEETGTGNAAPSITPATPAPENTASTASQYDATSGNPQMSTQTTVTTPPPATIPAYTTPAATSQVPPTTMAAPPQATQKPTPLTGPIIVATPTQAPGTQPTAALQDTVAQSSGATSPSMLSGTSANTTESATRKPAISPDEKTDLQSLMSQQAEKNAEKLKEALTRVPDSVKPSLEKAITSASKGYDEALKNIRKKR